LALASKINILPARGSASDSPFFAQCRALPHPSGSEAWPRSIRAAWELPSAHRVAGRAATPGRANWSPRCRGERPLALALGIDAHLLDGRMAAVPGMGTAISPNEPFHFSLPPQVPPPGGLQGTPCPLRSVGHSPAPPGCDAWEAQSRLDCWSSWSASRNTSPIIGLGCGLRGHSLSLAQRRALPSRSTPAAKRRGHAPWMRCMPCDASASALQNAHVQPRIGSTYILSLRA